MGPCLTQRVAADHVLMMHLQIVYEQDWLDTEMQNLNFMLESATAGSTWLQQVCAVNEI